MFASCFPAIYWTSAKKPQSRFALPALLVLAFATNLAQVPPALQVVPGGTALAPAINLADQSNEMIRNVLESRVLQRLGAWSFSIFLWQQPFHLMANQGDIDPNRHRRHAGLRHHSLPFDRSSRAGRVQPQLVAAHQAYPGPLCYGIDVTLS